MMRLQSGVVSVCVATDGILFEKLHFPASDVLGCRSLVGA